ncbi:phospholipid carrier-dependent glycosyltransferase [Spiractinospora alimapuensis]|uniref:dolichyl-phosphate-mannose--protein mannosyltransferase n=1 Tax=Spiractinospora alimapuensis TaxID=2820884 RepID=UPI001F29B6B3|nr:phospholipid carrier-dependent glycosyltransferase [Spiractinospora alimapuensis]QVQ51386.1 phospholipid carrier-dependent glycosyltransferase [Spiractinospora alimapuensis]
MSSTAVSSAQPPVADRETARRARLAPPLPGPWWLRWAPALLIGAFAGVLRFFRLGEPSQIYFDETYYAKDAFGLWQFGYERETVDYPDERAESADMADDMLSQGQTDIFTDGGSVVVHPPVGKWMIALGDWFWGVLPFGTAMSPVGWRFAAAVFGTLSVVLLVILAIRMTRSILLGGAAGVVMSVDGLHFTMSRIAMVDIFLTFWLLLGFTFLVLDRDQTRRRLVSLADRGLLTEGWLGMRWWRWAAGLSFGLAFGTKWSALFFIAAFGLLTVAWDYGARRAVGQRKPQDSVLRVGGLPVGLRGVGPRWFVFDAVPAFVQVVVVSFATYLVTWSGWIFTTGGHNRDWAANQPPGIWDLTPGPLMPVVDALRSLWHYHANMLSFHSQLSSEHDYMSMPWDWLVMRVPVVYHFDSEVDGCGAQDCVRTILGLGTPAIWWMALIALVVMAGWWMTFRDWRAGAVLIGVAATILPWIAFPDRTMFVFYALPALPFLILGIVLTLGLLLGPDAGTTGFSQTRRVLGGVVFGAALLLIVINFVYLYPVLSAEIIPREVWADRMWFETWISGNAGG